MKVHSAKKQVWVMITLISNAQFTFVDVYDSLESANLFMPEYPFKQINSTASVWQRTRPNSMDKNLLITETLYKRDIQNYDDLMGKVN
jgi:hypothetical protein